jgi:serine protease Do
VWLAGAGPAALADPSGAVFDKAAPENVAELKAIQSRVKKVLAEVLPATVAVRVGRTQGSGVIVSKEGHVLTAGHVSGRPGQEAAVILADGRTVKGKTLGADREIDSGLIRITDEGSWPVAPLGKSAALKKGQWCIAAGHPGGYKAGRTAVVRLGRILETNRSFLRTDCTLVGGDSGGPVFDMDGRVIGIHSCIGSRLTANLHVPVDAYRESWDRLLRGDAWGSPLASRAAGDAYLGVEADPDEGVCKITLVVAGSPAEKAGVKVNDIVTRFDGQAIAGISDLGDQIRHKKPGDRVNLDVLRGRQSLRLQIVLAKRKD